MNIKVSGKAHLKGKSKRTGNDYDFIQVHYLGKDRNVDGLAAKTLSLDPRFFPYDTILVDREYLLEFDDRGYPVEFMPVK